MPPDPRATDEAIERRVAFYRSLPVVYSAADVMALAPDAPGLVARGLTDALLAAVAARAPGLRALYTDGGARVTDAGLAALARFTALEELDLEYAALTDAAVVPIAAVPTLRWVDLGGCAGVTRAGLDQLRRARPDLEVEPAGL